MAWWPSKWPWRQRASLDRDIADEIKAHIEMAAARHMSEGMTADQARQRARREFGSVVEVQRLTHEVWRFAWLEQLWEDAWFGVRILWTSPGVSVTATLLIALVIGGNTTVFAIARMVLASPAAGVTANSLVMIAPVRPASSEPFMSYPDFRDISDASGMLDRPAAWTSERLTVSVAGIAHAVTGALVAGAFFDVLGVQPCEGRLLAPTDEGSPGDGLVAVVSERFRRDRLGQVSSAVGQRLLVNGLPTTVVGVACGGFRGALLTPGEDIWVPLPPYYRAIRSEASLVDRAQPLVITVAALPDGRSQNLTELRVSALASQLAERYPDSHADQRLMIVPYSATAVLPIARMSAPFLALLAALTLVTVVVVSANVANLMLARALVRQREVALRQAMGATRGRILRLLMLEGLTIALVAGAVASGVGWALARALVRMIGPGAAGGMNSFAPDWSLVAYALTLALICTVAFTTLPGLRTWRQPVLPLLKAGERPIAGGRSRAMNALVVAQFAFSVLLLTSAGLAYRSLMLVQSGDVGFNPDGLLSVTVRLGGRDAVEDRTTTPSERAHALARIELARERVLATGRITAATYVRRLPGAYLNTLTPMATDDGQTARAIRRVVGPEYLAALGVAPVLGRDIAASDSRDRPKVAVINQHVAQALWPGRSPIGQVISVGLRERAEVVGVAPNVFFDGPTHDPRPQDVFVAEGQDEGAPPIDLTLLVRHTGSVREAADIVGFALGGREDAIPIAAVATMADRLEQVTQNERAIARLLVVFAGLALLVAVLGLYAAAAFDAGRRVREFGVRLALGATATDISRDVLTSSGLLAGVGVVLGFAASAVVATLVGRQYMGVSPLDPPVYLAVTVGLVVVAGIAALGPAFVLVASTSLAPCVRSEEGTMREPALWRRRWAFVVLASVWLVGCSRRPGLNFDCAWVPDAPFVADLRNQADVEHVVDDLRTAEELEIRYRDRMSGYRLVETFGIVSRHGRNLAATSRPLTREAAQRCLDTLLDELATAHSLTRAEIESVRPQLAHRGVDWPVTLPVVALFAFALTRFTRWIGQRFDADEWRLAVAVSLVGALLIPTVVLGMGWLWAMLVEVVRLGNEHVGHRARAASLLTNFVVMFALGAATTAVAGSATVFRTRALDGSLRARASMP